MGYQPRKTSPKGAIHGYKKPLRERRKDRKRVRKGLVQKLPEEKHIPSEREIVEVTLKRLHTLGIQKFGSSPFNEHFDRWLMNVTSVLEEFESHPMGVDDEYIQERLQALATIKQQLDKLSRNESTLDQELKNLSDQRTRLKQINAEYSTSAGIIRGQRNREIKRLNAAINRLKKEQDEVIRMKTGFFHGISKKAREQKEDSIAQELNDKQTELELVMLDFSAKQKELKEEYDTKREPVLEEIKKFRRTIQTLEMDCSLEERWFACEAIIDAVNSFLMRKSTAPKEDLN
jgi:DNA repair exonuclease SbcCD ATPase subunit